MVNKLLVSCALLCLMLAACEREEDPKPDPNPTAPAPEAKVFAGLHDSNYHYQAFATPLEVQVTWDSLHHYGNGIDSLDMNLDGTADFYLHAYQLDTGNFTPIAFPRFSIECRTGSGWKVGRVDETYYAGLNTYVTRPWVASFEHGRRIDNNTKWVGMCDLYAMPGPTPFLISSGPWYRPTASGALYVAVRQFIGTDTNYGWIQVDATDENHLRFVRTAIQK